MNRPVLEVADLVRAAGDGFIERRRRWIHWKHVKVLRAIAQAGVRGSNPLTSTNLPMRGRSGASTTALDT
jgi:hypothetical protein